jgi:ABC-type sugar transport system permease subunit
VSRTPASPPTASEFGFDQAAARPTRKRRGSRWPAAIRESAFVLPALAVSLAVFLVPTAVGVELGFQDWAPGARSKWVGLENFLQVLDDPSFQEAARNTAFYLLGVPLWTLVPLVLALVLYERVPGANALRTLWFLPSLLSPTVVSIIAYSLLQPDGAINRSLRAAGLGSFAQDWIDDPALVRWTVIAVTLWAGAGVGVMIFSAALAAVPPELFEAARMDGASWWQQLRHVAIPGVHKMIEAYAAFNVVTVFVFFFGWVYVLTGGGPGFSSATLDLDVYQRAFAQQEWGLASAEAVILLTLVAAVVTGLILARWLLRRAAASPLGRLLGGLGDIAYALQVRRAERHRDTRGTWSSRPRRRRWSPVRTALCVALSLGFVYPFVNLVFLAVKSESDFQRDPTGMPQSFTDHWFRYAWSTGGLGASIWHSALAVGVGVVVCVAVAMPAAFWFWRHPARLPRLLLLLLLGFLALPIVLWLFPLFVELSRLGITSNLWILGLVYAATQVPLALGLLLSYLRHGLPPEICEAAAIDGASLLAMFRRVVVPLARPALGTVVALTFLFLWSDLLISLILIQDPARFTALVAASGLIAKGVPNLQAAAAAGVILTLPVLAVLAVAQRAIVRGFTAGSGKL